MPKKQRSTKEIFRQLSTDLRTAAVRPNISGYKPHEKQATFHQSPARGKLFIGGNRSGKTVGGAAEGVWRATGHHPYRAVPPPPTRGRVIAVDFLEGVNKIVLPEIARWIPKSELRNGSWEDSYDRQDHTLTLANGSFIEFMSYEQDLEKFAGTSRHWEWFDEEPPQDIYVECLARLIDTGGDWWITMTPVDGMTWTYDDLYESKDPNILVIEVDTLMNPHINPVEIEVLFAGLTDDEKSARLHGQYVQRGGLIYPMFKEAVHVIKPIDPKLLKPDKWLHVASMDHGFNNPTAWLWGAVDEEGRIVIYREHYQRGWVVKRHAQYVLLQEQGMGVPVSYRVGDPSIRNVDPVTGTSVQIEYVENQVPIVLGVNDVKAGLDNVARRLGQPPSIPPKLFITRDCEQLIWELKRYRWSLWASKRMDRDKNRKEEPHKKDDHAVDALRYFCASRPMVEDLSVPSEIFRDKPANQAISPYRGLVDTGVTAPSRSENTDFHLGEDY